MSATAELKVAPPLGAGSVPKPTSRWIQNFWRDLLLYVGTPLLILPVFAAAQQRWSAQDIYLFVAAFGATGHHLPGMIRAYGDRALFERFKVRFILAPLFLALVCIFCSTWKLMGLEVVVFAWGIWHGLMQTYGFCRIYDAKTGAFAALNRRLDFAMCLTWFGSAILLSPQRFRSWMDLYYAGGGPIIPAGPIMAMRAGAVWVVGAVTLAFLVGLYLGWRQGQRVNPVKLLLMGGSFAFWWYCNLGVANILVGVALFEVFHDVQYLSIVWLYNRNRVEKDQSIKGFMRFVFRRSGSLLGIYVGLVLAYGALAAAARGVPMDGVRNVLMGVVTASALLHFYYDGFIWKVRESSTRKSFGLEGGADTTTVRRWGIPPWLVHGLKWTPFVLPVAVLGWMQLHPPSVSNKMAVREAVAAAVPDDSTGHRSLGVAAQAVGKLDEAVIQYREALRLHPDDAETHFNLGSALVDQWELDAALLQYLEAIRLQPDYPQAECNLANLQVKLGRFSEAKSHYERSLQLKPDQELVHKNFADLLLQLGRNSDARAHYAEALRIRPNYAAARVNLEALQAGRF